MAFPAINDRAWYSVQLDKNEKHLDVFGVLELVADQMAFFNLDRLAHERFSIYWMKTTIARPWHIFTRRNLNSTKSALLK